ncbi:MAG: caspase family protein [Imperialibacter sp.]|uniref:caspase family protein n=1 Tax=Imperialibacter sp. TaxID=2038411 RepID=UPI0032F06D7B
MKLSLCLAFFAISTGSLFAQTTVDKLRLTYDEEQVHSKQNSLTVSNDGQLIAFAFDDKTIKLVNAVSGKTVRTFRGVHQSPFDLRISQSKNEVVSVEGNAIVVLNIINGEQLAAIDVTKDITRVAISYTDNLLAVGTEGSEIYVYNLSDNAKQVQKISGVSHHVSGLDFDPNGRNILASFKSGYLGAEPAIIYDIQSGKVVEELRKAYYHFVQYSVNGKSIISCEGLPGKIAFWEYQMAANRYNKIYDQLNLVSVSLYTSAVLKDNLLMSSSVDYSFDVFDISSKEKVFSTKRDKVKLMMAPANQGVDKKRIYPLHDGKSFLINYSNNNVTQIYNAEANEIVGFIYADANDDLVTVSRGGQIDGSLEAISKIYWAERNLLSRVSLDATFDKYYTPNLLAKILSGATISESSTTLEQDIEHVSSITLTQAGNARGNSASALSSSQKSLELKVQITEHPEYTTEVRLYHNAKLLATKKSQGSSTDFDFTASLNNAYGEENYFYAVAVNKEGIESEKAKLIVRYQANAEAKPKLVALIVGINKYKNPKYELNYALTDAKSVAKQLDASSTDLFEKVEKTELYDGQVTKESILAAFAKISKNINEQDLFVFYYAGHGTVSEEDVENEFYLVPYDVTQMYGNAGTLKDRAVSAADLKELSMKINAQKQVFIIDACQSAGALQTVATRGAAEEKALAQLARSTGTFWLTAAGSEQFATEFEQLGHGVFTYSILEGLSGKNMASSTDGIITIRELSSYIEQRVPALSEEYKGKSQYPASFSFGNDFPIQILQKK